jgi:hypothetical protein
MDLVVVLAALITAISYIVIAVVSYHAVRIEVDRRTTEVKTLILAESQANREQVNLATEQRRVAEVNVRLRKSLLLTAPATDIEKAENETPFTIFSLSLKNDGDGPVDILASLTASRIMSSHYRSGMGLHNRDVEWEDHQPFFWNQAAATRKAGIEKDGEGETPLFTGISTTRTMVAAGDEFTRLAPHEIGTLRRIDGVNDPIQLVSRAPVYMLYRVFLVARGYPLGEILRQQGAVPPELLQSVNRQLLNFQTVAQPNYASWSKVQEALLNLSRMAFKVASGEQDALGKLAYPDAFRFFLLRHKEFTGQIGLVDGEKKTMNEVASQFWEFLSQFYPKYQLPKNFGADESDQAYQQAQKKCQEWLKPMLKSWESLNEDIKQCREYPTKGYPPDLFRGALLCPDGCPDEGYCVRVHTDPVYHSLWLTLLDEGYLLSKPFPLTLNQDSNGAKKLAKAKLSRASKKPEVPTAGKELGGYDMPADPRVLEPFVMRVHYFQATLNVDPELQHLYLAAKL